jgi:hypothetical protein
MQGFEGGDALDAQSTKEDAPGGTGPSAADEGHPMKVSIVQRLAGLAEDGEG